MSKKLTTEEFVTKANLVHNSKYDYSKTVYDGARSIVMITCPIHGDFKQEARDHTNGKNGCQKCSLDTIKKKLQSNSVEFIEKANRIHKNKYSYKDINYVNAKTKIDIICPLHGIFKQTPNDHLNGCGCRYCRTENIGWTDTKWKEHGEVSEYFTGYKLYVVKIYDSEESFIKIGKTFVDISRRFNDIAQYYHYKVLHTIEADADTICKLERKYQRMNKEYKYTPKVQFSGYTECFSKVIINGVTYEN